MRILKPLLLAAGAVLGLSSAQAGGVLQGLEMDVMDPGETSAQAISRIALPKTGNLADENPDYAGVLSEQALVGGGAGRDATPGEFGNEDMPDGPVPTDGPSAGIDVGESVPGGIGGGDDGIVIDDGGIIGEEPPGGGIEPVPGDTIVIDDIIEGPVEDARDNTPIGGTGISIMPLEVPESPDIKVEN
jgi:hypothetical protein